MRWLESLVFYVILFFVLNIVIVTNCVRLFFIIIVLFEKLQSGSIMKIDIAALYRTPTLVNQTKTHLHFIKRYLLKCTKIYKQISI